MTRVASLGSIFFFFFLRKLKGKVLFICQPLAVVDHAFSRVCLDRKRQRLQWNISLQPLL
ncbi:hypothetical protein CEV31_1502 [Brucella thiophenivorans]|uniref:Uncharacterized protein n=1 Tax=Brucella thiophenivorans TaxID=571255 RepID=A0A256FZ08_9HYPH|nr:hypothetical protein CEV31_1502 [Brucella thiophenivorans]